MRKRLKRCMNEHWDHRWISVEQGKECTRCKKTSDVKYVCEKCGNTDMRFSGNCRKCHNDRMRAYYRKDPSRFLKINRKALYNITDEEYQNKLRNQIGTCAICNRPPNGRWKSLHVDHDHTSGKFRGLLCSNCNIALGLVREDVSILRNMESYLEENGQ